MEISLIKPTYTSEQISMKIKIPKPEHDKMTAYMKWAGFESGDDFIQQAIQFVLDSDKGFKKYLQQD